MEPPKMKDRILQGMNGILAIVFGTVTIFFPSITLIGLAVYFAISIIIGGTLLILAAIRMRKWKTKWPMQLFEGIIGIVLGIFILSKPELSAAVFMAIIGIWAILLGIYFLFMYFRRGTPEFGRMLLLTVGILSLIFGLLIVTNPFESSRFIIILIGIYAIIYGLFSFISTRRLPR